MDVQTLADRLEITDLLTRYAHAVDSRDWDLYRTVFTPDAHIDYESAGGIKGDLETVVAWLETTMAGFPSSQHLISNVGVELDGDTARVRAAVFNPMTMPDGGFFQCGGFYRHDLVRTTDGWRSSRLVEDLAWMQSPGGSGAP